jgi:hypothetical protein
VDRGTLLAEFNAPNSELEVFILRCGAARQSWLPVSKEMAGRL